ncbi:hypothetical protein HDA32_004352 [Spinactinospora alkalitolerans]|uniref:Uncharacterized protein n=1 Tax=Spinactinospora alkalitolerans TaxID=687207 RepID=A0A852U1K3_9ACTN|nr:hypothetical protein [Spinactinospora alkalitolerans]
MINLHLFGGVRDHRRIGTEQGEPRRRTFWDGVASLGA